jgi:uncharacterized coiled-coil protein SlyX
MRAQLATMFWSVGLISLASVTPAQEPHLAPISTKPLHAKADKLTASLAVGAATAPNPSGTAASAPTAPELADLEARLKNLENRLANQDDVMREEFQEIRKDLKDVEATLAKLAGTASEQNERHVLAPTSMKETAKPVLPQYGTLRVVNRMRTAQNVKVNQTSFAIPALSTQDLNVPFGTVTTELVGHEPAKQFSLKAPVTLQQLVIAAEPVQTTVASPLPSPPPASQSPAASSKGCGCNR